MKAKNRFTDLTPPTPVFPASYEPKGQWNLSPLAEEMLWAAAKLYGAENPMYWERLVETGNFWECLKPELDMNDQRKVFPRDFVPVLQDMRELQKTEADEKKAYRAAHRAELKKEADELKEKCGFALVDGEKIKVPFQIEGPGIILTRGKDPRFGCWKYRVEEKDVTLNVCGAGTAPAGWKGKTENSPTSQWVLKYKQQCGRPGMTTAMQLPKKVNLGGEIATKNIEKKFDKTLSAIKAYPKIETAIKKGLKSKSKKERETALVVWLLAETGIRVGGERDLSKFAETYGASTLQKKHFEILED